MYPAQQTGAAGALLAAAGAQAHQCGSCPGQQQLGEPGVHDPKVVEAWEGCDLWVPADKVTTAVLLCHGDVERLVLGVCEQAGEVQCGVCLCVCVCVVLAVSLQQLQGGGQARTM